MEQGSWFGLFVQLIRFELQVLIDSRSSSSSETDTATAVDEPAEDVVDYSTWHSKRLKGLLLDYEQHGEVGDPDYYRRLIIHCNCLKHATAKRCTKKRNLGPRQCKQLGSIEPIAFLGAWGSRFRSFDNQSDHNKFNPTLQDMKDWLEGEGVAYTVH